MKHRLLQVVTTLTLIASAFQMKASCEEVAFWQPVKTSKGNNFPLVINIRENIATLSIQSKAVYKYTLDGQNPTQKSRNYCAPIHIAKNLTLKIIKFEAGKISPVTALTFTKTTNQNQSEDLAAVNVDFSEAPELKDFALKSRKLAERYHPMIHKLLKTPGFKTYKQVMLIFKKMDGVAATAGNVIYFAKDWYLKHPEDYGSVIHELTHVVQHYPKYEPWWVVEGIADYVRNFHFEPLKKRQKLNFKGGSY
ncbi:MAG: chitobiase/beta-hexosaminidase C-terminal domain-containing protein, partial [Lentisphaeria bacterium]|nr:chitobiase/beta-hexosaminidase C-terminal domain-containing protein [Lentisphaeria bacterium]